MSNQDSIGWVLVLMCLVGMGCLPGSDYKGFETGDFSGWMLELAQPYSGRIVTAPVRCGDYAARFEIREGDEQLLVIGYRAEVHELLYHVTPIGGEQWYGFSTYIPTDWPDLENRTVISQWHATPDIGEVWRSPPLAVRYTGGRLTITGRYSAEPIQTENDGIMLDLYTHPGALQKGTWHDWVFHVRWHYGSGGFVRAWRDHTQVIDYEGPIGYNDFLGVWFKWGIYRDDHPATQVIYHDEYRRGNSYDEVSPGSCNDP
jgi:hypothetical protein